MSHLQFLVVEDEALIRKFMVSQLSKYGRVFEADCEQKANQILANTDPDMAFIDLNLTESSELEGLRLVQKCAMKDIPSVVLTGHQEKDIFDKAYQKGAHHFFTKGDLSEGGHLNHSIVNFIKTLKPDNLKHFFTHDFITRDEGLRSKVRFLQEQILNYDQKVLISGPTGVGKTRIAEFIHQLMRPNRPFVAKNLTEISENLFEAELFGYKKGAFTGATQDKVGLLELAHQGTLFLDEVGTLPLSVQQKLLKVLEEKKFTPLGTNEERFSDFRLISATCEELGEKVNNGELRIDFYFRIKGVEIEIPPLKERRCDVLPLIDHFVDQSEKKVSFSAEAQTKLLEYDWYGNVRELRAFVQQCMSYPKGLIGVEDLPDCIQENRNPILKSKKAKEGEFVSPKMLAYIYDHGLPALVKEIEKEVLANAIDKYGNKTNALARRLQVSKSVFYRIQEELKRG